jgi:hypothetical protein
MTDRLPSRTLRPLLADAEGSAVATFTGTVRPGIVRRGTKQGGSKMADNAAHTTGRTASREAPVSSHRAIVVSVMGLRVPLVVVLVLAAAVLSACGGSSTSSTSSAATSSAATSASASSASVVADAKQKCLDATKKIQNSTARSTAEQACGQISTSNPNVTSALNKAKQACLTAAAKIPIASIKQAADTQCNKVTAQ